MKMTENEIKTSLISEEDPFVSPPPPRPRPFPVGPCLSRAQKV